MITTAMAWLKANPTKIMWIVVALSAIMGGLCNKPAIEKFIDEKTSQVASTEDNKIVKKVTRVITKPDGTKEEVIEEVTETNKKTVDTTTKQNKTQIIVKKKNFRIGAKIGIEELDVSKKTYSLEVGKYLTDSVSVDFQYTHNPDKPKKPDLSVGISLEF